MSETPVGPVLKNKNRKAYDEAHANADTNESSSSIHHTLGYDSTQAAPGSKVKKLDTDLRSLETKVTAQGYDSFLALYATVVQGFGINTYAIPTYNTALTITRGEDIALTSPGSGTFQLKTEGIYQFEIECRWDGASDDGRRAAFWEYFTGATAVALGTAIAFTEGRQGGGFYGNTNVCRSVFIPQSLIDTGVLFRPVLFSGVASNTTGTVCCSVLKTSF